MAVAATEHGETHHGQEYQYATSETTNVICLLKIPRLQHRFLSLSLSIAMARWFVLSVLLLGFSADAQGKAASRKGMSSSSGALKRSNDSIHAGHQDCTGVFSAESNQIDLGDVLQRRICRHACNFSTEDSSRIHPTRKCLARSAARPFGVLVELRASQNVDLQWFGFQSFRVLRGSGHFF